MNVMYPNVGLVCTIELKATVGVGKTTFSYPKT